MKPPKVGPGERAVAGLIAEWDGGAVEIAGISVVPGGGRAGFVWRCGCGVEMATFDAAYDHAREIHRLPHEGADQP